MTVFNFNLEFWDKGNKLMMQLFVTQDNPLGSRLDCYLWHDL